MPSKPTWAGRLPGGLDPDAWSFLHSLPYDTFLAAEDVEGSIAHVAALREAGVLTVTEARKLHKALREIEIPFWTDEDEDVHSALERVLTERLGDLGAKVHAGRSRNDQVATALRLWTRARLTEIREALAGLIGVLAARADEHAATLAPGYTHLQRAQPVSLGHWLCAHAWALERDLSRLDLALSTTDACPLGAGALATSTLGIDPALAARELGFARPFANSMDAVSARDFLADGTYACASIAVHLSRLAEEIVLWSSSEFAFVRLPDAFATGSSMMPQKRNPDVAELARGVTGPAVGALAGLLTTLKSLPLSYDRDLQADKLNLRGCFQTTRDALRAMRGLVAGLVFDEDRLAEAASDPALLATDLAERLVAEGVPFRTAHERVAGMARDGSLARAVADAGLDARASVRLRGGRGGPSADSVRRQVAALRRRAQT